MSGAGVFPTELGESFVGEGANAAHVNTVLGALGGPVETAWATALASPSQGHTPFVTVLQPGLPVKPYTLFVNKAAIAGERHARLTWGAAQAGIAKGVADAVAARVIDPARVDDLVLIAAVWVDPAAERADLVFANNARAMHDALVAGRDRLPPLERVLAARDHPHNPFFDPERS